MAKKEKEPEGDIALEGEAPKKSKKKMIIMIVILVVLLGALGGGGWFGWKWWQGRKAASAGGENATEQKADAHGGGEKKDEKGGHGEGKDAKGGEGAGAGSEIVSLPPLLVNLADPQGRRYLKLGLDIEVKDKPAADELNKNMAKVKDTLLLLLSSKTYDDLASLENKILLKKEIVERLTLVLGEQKVLRVYITEIVIQ